MILLSGVFSLGPSPPQSRLDRYSHAGSITNGGAAQSLRRHSLPDKKSRHLVPCAKLRRRRPSSLTAGGHLLRKRLVARLLVTPRFGPDSILWASGFRIERHTWRHGAKMRPPPPFTGSRGCDIWSRGCFWQCAAWRRRRAGRGAGRRQVAIRRLGDSLRDAGRRREPSNARSFRASRPRTRPISISSSSC